MNFVQFITTKRFVKHFALSLLTTIILSWITLILLKQYTLHGASSVVPSFIGLSMDQLSELESSQEFDILVVDSVYDYDKKGGTIVSQDPLPNSKVKPGRTIYISVVAYVPEQIKMPALIDLSVRQAKALLQTYGLKLGGIKLIPDPAKNAVLYFTCRGNRIQAGSILPKGSVIDLFVGSGAGGTEVNIPFLIGKSRTEALSEIVRLGLQLGNEVFQGDADTLDSKVYLQDPTYIYGKRIPVTASLNLTYKSARLFDFDAYIESLEIDTVYSDSLNNIN